MSCKWCKWWCTQKTDQRRSVAAVSAAVEEEQEVSWS
jgi:hypothetical protein